VEGYSDAAQTALELGIRHPGRVAGLVLGGVVAEPTAQYVQALGAIGFIEPGWWTLRGSSRCSLASSTSSRTCTGAWTGQSTGAASCG
jgi:pimeloyl-ACP methyl ester carboxylesterase